MDQQLYNAHTLQQSYNGYTRYSNRTTSTHISRTTSTQQLSSRNYCANRTQQVSSRQPKHTGAIDKTTNHRPESITMRHRASVLRQRHAPRQAPSCICDSSTSVNLMHYDNRLSSATQRLMASARTATTVLRLRPNDQRQTNTATTVMRTDIQLQQKAQRQAALRASEPKTTASLARTTRSEHPAPNV